MPKNKVNNNIKLKSGGGILNDATDGLSVDTGTTDGKIVAMTTGDKLPAVDGSNLTNVFSGMFVNSASDNLRYSANTERTVHGTNWTKVKEIKINRAGTVRVKFDLKSAGGFQAMGRIYKNGSAIGTERTTASSSYQTYSEDIVFAAGDLIQIYTCSVSSSGNSYISNNRIYYDLTPLAEGQVITD